MVVTEGAAICAYLADAFPQADLAPATTDKARGTYYRWMFFAAGPVEAAASNKSMGWEAPADKQGMVGYGTLGHVMDALEVAVAKGPYILGEKFSAADVYVGAHIMWGMQFGTLEKRPAYEAYAARLHNRPAAVRARELDDALIAEQQKAG
jgi:glutathione S-transferase